MSSATPIAARVWEVLLYTSAPSASCERTRPRASAPVAARSDRIPLRSSAAAVVAIRSSEASSVNSADATGSGLTTAGSPVTAGLRQPPVDQCDGHRTLADGGCAALDGPEAHVPCREHP